jgi:dihydrofolate synthase/folylpolyglutamate synthase
MKPLLSTLQEAYAWLDSQIDYERRPDAAAADPEALGLDRIGELLAALGDPHREIPAVHIAGTRGKGSSALALEALLAASGLRAATFTSPHLREYRERIRIDGAPIEAEGFCAALEAVARAPIEADGERRSFKTVFESLTAAFFQAAREAGVDCLVVETGLGGRLDATNVLPPGPVLLTRIGQEHTSLLGATIPLIAAEKAAILKSGGWGVFNRQAAGGEAEAVFRRRALETGAPLTASATLCPPAHQSHDERGSEFAFEFEGARIEFQTRLLGPHLAENFQGALAVTAELRRRRSIPVVPAADLAGALSRLELPGRLERVELAGGGARESIVDGAHCPTAAEGLARAMAAHFPGASADLVVGMMDDKDHAGFFRAMAEWKGWRRCFCHTAPSPRAASGAELARAAAPFFSEIRVFPDVQSALESAFDSAEEGRRIVAAGTLYAVAAALEWSRPHGREHDRLGRDRCAPSPQAQPQADSGNPGAQSQAL